MDIKRVIKEYYEQLYAHRFNLDKTDQFFEESVKGIDNLIGLYLIKKLDK